MADEKEVKTIAAPKIEVALIVEEGGTLDDCPYESVLILHLPDGRPPHAIPLDGGPWDRPGATMLIETIYTAIGEKFAPTKSIGAMGLERHRT